MDAIVIDKYETPASKYPRKTLGSARIASHWWSPGFYMAYGSHPPGHTRDYAYVHAERKLKMTNLLVGGKTVMVDDCPHWWTIQKHAQECTGHVLVAGLGLGLIVHALAANAAVTSITVVEINPDVIALLKPLIPRCHIVCTDWYKYRTRRAVHSVFFDLFVGKAKNLFVFAVSEMLRLRKTYPHATHKILGFSVKMLIECCQLIEDEKASLDTIDTVYTALLTKVGGLS